MSLDSRQLRCFVAVAEELHFGRAAARLGIVQSALSAQLARLEDVIGGLLLQRGRKSAVRLTALGVVFLAEARQVVAQLERAERVGREASRGAAGPIRLSYVFSAALNGVLVQALRAISAALPLVEVSAFPLDTPEQLTALAEGRADIGFLRPQKRYPDGVSARIVHREPVLLAVGTQHPLARHAQIPAAALAGENFIIPQMARSLGLPQLVNELAASGGFALAPSLGAGDFVTAACMAAGGYGVVLAPRSLARFSIEGVCYRPIAGFAAMLELAMAWRGAPTPPVRAILAAHQPPELAGPT